jgi:hypothetical protein
MLEAGLDEELEALERCAAAMSASGVALKHQLDRFLKQQVRV